MIASCASARKAAMVAMTRSFSSERIVRVGCASGFWGDTPTAPAQLIHAAKPDYIIFDYLSELTMSLLTAAKQKQPDLGYAPDFVMAGVGPHLAEIKRKGIRVISNAGGINTSACAAALREACKKAGVDLKVAEVHGDNMIPLKDELLASGSVREMFSGRPLPASVHSMTAYFGAGPVVRALEMGADIVVTGRTADSAMALAPYMHEFGWKADDLDQLAAGCLAGHLMECGGQVTGGLFTDWEQVQGYENLGFPIIEMNKNGEMLVTKPAKTGGLLTPLTVAEQMLYEIGDPANYVLPDVNCDFTQVRMFHDEKSGGVRVVGAKGKPPTDTFKVSATYLDGYKSTAVAVVAGGRATAKGRKTAEAIMARARMVFKHMGLKDFDRTYVSVLGAEDSFGRNARSASQHPREAVIWMSVQHTDKKAIDAWAREIASSGTGMTPGLCSIVGGRPKATPCLKLFSFLYPKAKLPATVRMGDGPEEVLQQQPRSSADFQSYHSGAPAAPAVSDVGTVRRGNSSCTLGDLAVARSGDKGDTCNIGVVARRPEYLPYIAEALSQQAVFDYFAHFFPASASAAANVQRFDVPGVAGFNLVLLNVLDGGGMASLRPDPLGKAFAQMLLDLKIEGIPSLDQLHAA